MARSKNQAKEETNTAKVKYMSVRKKTWHDLQDDGYVYKQGDIFPREGLEVSEERIKELSTINNKLGEILIQKVEIEENIEEKETVVEEIENTETDSIEDEKEDTEDSETNTTEEGKEETENTEE